MRCFLCHAQEMDIDFPFLQTKNMLSAFCALALYQPPLLVSICSPSRSLSACRWVRFLVSLRLLKTRDDSRTLIQLSFLTDTVSPLPLSCIPRTFGYASIILSFKLGVVVSAITYLCKYLYIPAFIFWGLDGHSCGPHIPFFESLPPSSLALLSL